MIRDHELVFYDRFLKDVANDWDERPPAELYVLGANEWRGEREWPLARATPTAFHLRSGGALSVDGPTTDEPVDRYDYDPADPVPTVGGVNSVLTMTQGAETPIRPGPVDQRVLEARDDVLVYTSEPLERDLEVIGPCRDDAVRRVVGARHRLHRAALRRVPGRTVDLPHGGDHPRPLPRAASRASRSSCSSRARSPSTGSASTPWRTSSAAGIGSGST